MAKEEVDALDVVRNAVAAIGPDGLLSMLTTTLHELMNVEVSARCGAGYGERSPDRVVCRNGTRERPFETRLGTVSLSIPKLHEGSYFPSFLKPMGAKGMSKSQVSRMASVLDAQVSAFRERQLGDKRTPYIYLDALSRKVRDERVRRSSRVSWPEG